MSDDRSYRLRIGGDPSAEVVLQKLTQLLETMDEAISVDSDSEPFLNGKKPDSVVLVWSNSATDSMSLHREIAEWDRQRVRIHIIDTKETPLLGYVKEMASSIHVLDGDEGFINWIRADVLAVTNHPLDHNGVGKPTTYSSALKLYHLAIQNQYREIHTAGATSPVNFKDVYLPIRLRSGDDLLKDISLSNLADKPGSRLFTIGGPGSGKTTLLRYLTLSLARDKRALPLLVDAKGVIDTGTRQLSDYLRLIIKGTVRQHGRAVSDQLLVGDQFGDGSTVLLIDAIDELGPDHRVRVRQLLRAFETEFPEATIVVSSRPSGYDSVLWEGFRPLHLQSLDDESVLNYIEKFASEGARERIYDLIDSSVRLHELVCIPFMLSMICACEVGKSDIPIRRAQFIKICVEGLINRRKLPLNLSLKQEDVHSCLAEVSERLFRLDPSTPHSRVEFIFAIESFLHSRGLLQQPADTQFIASAEQANLILDAIIDCTGLVQSAGEDIDYTHRSIWEYFVAATIVDRPTSNLNDVANNGFWEEPIRLAIGLDSEETAKNRLEHLWKKNPELVLRGSVESPHDLVPAALRELMLTSPEEELSALVREIGSTIYIRDRSESELLILETLRVLLPETSSCQILWEGLQVLLKFELYRKEAIELITQVFQLDNVASRLSSLTACDLDGVRFIAIPGGQFWMGNDDPNRSVDERPRHRVSVNPFSIGATTITNSAKLGFPFNIGTGDDPRSPDNSCPLIGVTWYEAAIFSFWFGCRLPSEAEWEYACRGAGRDDSLFLDEASIPKYAWYAENAQNRTHQVAQLLPNSLGLYDMLGNAREWCNDWFNESYYGEAPEKKVWPNPTGPESGTHKVLRGGCFDWNTTNLVPTYRNYNLPNNRGFQNSLRLVLGWEGTLSSFLGDYQSEKGELE